MSNELDLDALEARAERAEAQLRNLRAQAVIDYEAAVAEIAEFKARIAAALDRYRAGDCTAYDMYHALTGGDDV